MSEEEPPRFTPGLRPSGSVKQRSLWFAFRGRQLLITETHQIQTVESLEMLGLRPIRSQYLGQLDELHCYSAELDIQADPPEGYRFADLGTLYGHFEDWLHALAGRAVQIMDWDRTHQYCGACASPTQPSGNERSRRCPACGQVYFPRLAPAMIVAVERDDELLMARGKHFPPGIYSVLAGFVEPGESLEESVAREVFEESGVHVEDVRYFGSQPWPFPNSLMLGFTARYRSGEIRVDGEEIEAAGFYRWDELPKVFPGNVSIAQWLIRDFVERHRT